MKTAAFILTAAACLIWTAAASAGSLAGRWYSKTGSHVITIYKSGPEYSAAIPETKGTITGAPEGQLTFSLSNFNVSGNRVHFGITTDAWTPSVGLVTIWQKFDLTLTEDGSRLIGTSTTSDSRGGKHRPEATTLFLRNG